MSYHTSDARLDSEQYGIFVKAAGTRKGETVVMCFSELPDKATRDAGTEKMTGDPRMQFEDPQPTFDGRHLIAGGFVPMFYMARED